ncbi:MAG: hypothetical protein ABIR68_01440 [Ilumatobacteraceae bacterium]
MSERDADEEAVMEPALEVATVEVPARRTASPDEPPRSKLFVPAFILGWLIIWYGATRALSNRVDSNPAALIQHVIAFDLFHDLVIAPVVVLAGWLLGKVLRPVARGPVRAAAAMTAITLVFAYPLFRRWGVRPTNSSTLPLPYARNIVIVLAVVWAAAALVIVWRMRHDHTEPAV